MVMVAKLKDLNVERPDIDDLMELQVWARALQGGYGYYDVAQPAWLGDAISRLDREIRRRAEDNLRARRQEILSRREGLMTKEEQRRSLDDELAAIDAKLNQATA